MLDLSNRREEALTRDFFFKIKLKKIDMTVLS